MQGCESGVNQDRVTKIVRRLHGARRRAERSQCG